MRTTVALDPDVAAEVERFRRQRSVGLSVAINELIRRGSMQATDRPPFVQRTSPMGARMDVANVADVLETLDGPSAR